MKEIDVKSFITSIHEMSKDMEDCLSLLYNAFIYNKFSFIDEAEGIITRIRDAEKGLTDDLIAASPSDKVARLYSTVPSHFERIASNFEHMARALRIKIKEDLLFSDKAISEVNFLLNRVKEVLNTLSDLVLARNTYVANYIKESEREIERTATEFATLHEERLIEGLCLPKSSGVYILLLDSIKRIAWNAREIAEKLA